MTYEEWTKKHPTFKHRTFEEFQEEIKELVSFKCVKSENLSFNSYYGIKYLCEFDINNDHYEITYDSHYRMAKIYVNDKRVFNNLLTMAYEFFTKKEEQKKKYTAYLTGWGKTACKCTCKTIQVDNEEEARAYCKKSQDSMLGEYDYYFDYLEENK